jgi:hypothetical protein
LLFLRQWKVYVLPRFRHKPGTGVREAKGMRHEATGNSQKVKVIGVALSAMLFAFCAFAQAHNQRKSLG